MEGLIPTHTPFPYKSLQRYNGEKDDIIVHEKHTFYKIIYKFLRLCRKKYQNLHHIGCKLKLMPGLIIPWKKSSAAVYISFFSETPPLPSTWIIFKKNNQIRVKEGMPRKKKIIISPRLRPIFQTPSCVDKIWYSPDTRMTVAYTYENILHLLPEPVWVIDRKRAKPWKSHYSIVNQKKDHDDDAVREIKISHLHPQSPAWSVFKEGSNTHRQPLNYFLGKSLMWGMLIYKYLRRRRRSI